MFVLGLIATVALTSPLCDRALEAAPDLHCVPAQYGVALAPDAELAARLSQHAGEAEARFATHFGQPIAPYAVFSVPPVPSRQALADAGFQAVLPWPAPRIIDSSIRERVETQTREFAVGMNMNAEQTEQVVARALSQLPTPATFAAIDAGMVPHELGHLWTHEAFWASGDQASGAEDRPRHYGSPAPDWLDEAAGILLEDAPTADQRREQFRSLMAGVFVPAVGANGSREFLLDLEGLLERQHPGLDRAAPGLDQARTSGGVAVAFTPASQSASGPPNGMETLFYIQTRVFTDFLMHLSDRPTIIADITRGLSTGQTFEQWLGTEGAGHNLPSTVSGLQQAWSRYAAQL